MADISRPMFVRIDEFKDIQGIMDVIKKKLNEAKSTLDKIHNLKNDEDTELDRWNSILEEIERRMEFIDKTIFGIES